MARKRTPNTALARCIRSADITYEALARAVNAVGAEVGLDLRYDRTSIAHWLGGARPRGPVPELLAEALARRLHRPVAPAEIGLAEADDTAPQSHTDTVAAILDLGRADMDIDRRTLLRHTVYSLAAVAAIPAWAEIAERSARAVGATTPRIGTGEVDAVRTMAEAFSGIDDQFGGGHARSSVAAYIAGDLTRWLRADAPVAVRADLYSAAADLLYLAGFMAWDDAAHGLAQRYYLRAVDLAAQAEDAATYATVLRGMSLQANSLGHHLHGLHLAEAAVSAVGTSAPPRMRAFLLGQQAVSLAAVGERQAAVRTLSTAERHLEAASSSPSSTFGGYHPAALAFQEAHLRAHLGDVAGAAAAMKTSTRRRPAMERRSRAMATAHLAEYQYRAGHLEASCATWNTFLDDYPHLVAGRADAAFKRARNQAQRHRTNTAARALSHRLAGMRTRPWE
ncbi:tetratricopeptide repeat protein [Streptomonospora nanhaiensis]|uniref:tetratricopeptide repeat protein n=1 Tax=Streptomonospora nanhaiensis TaxID=1323731 RepID=UPI001C390865|nr:tetratricopeptide repeat protein [Streptomonospora nanhaiensis]MBV2366852.1 tetratricopeptide repeat protein [Streptomonospora nanhaiensis]MBX9387642.1 tetratricopeptide repeat protein [Streptomonospora nanhaiensis]